MLDPHVDLLLVQSSNKNGKGLSQASESSPSCAFFLADASAGTSTRARHETAMAWLGYGEVLGWKRRTWGAANVRLRRISGMHSLSKHTSTLELSLAAKNQ